MPILRSGRKSGPENISYLAGLRADEIQAMRRQGTYAPREYTQRNPAVQRVMDALYSGVFSPQEPGLLHWFYSALLDQGDYYFHLADLESYLLTQERAASRIYSTGRVGSQSYP